MEFEKFKEQTKMYNDEVTPPQSERYTLDVTAQTPHKVSWNAHHHDKPILGVNGNEFDFDAGDIGDLLTGDPHHDDSAGNQNKRLSESSMFRDDDFRRRSSGAAVQALLSELDMSVDANMPSPPADGVLLRPELPWKVLMETHFQSKYLRNDRKNIQCFPTCTLQGGHAAQTAANNGNPANWCRGPVFARAFAVDPETNLADMSLFECYGVFCKGQAATMAATLADHPNRLRGTMTKVDARSVAIRIMPSTWKYDEPLKKKFANNENKEVFFFCIVMLFRGNEIGRSVSPPFELGSHKSTMRKKRQAMEGTDNKLVKRLVQEPFAQASRWTLKTFAGIDYPPEVEQVSDDDCDIENQSVMDAQELKYAIPVRKQYQSKRVSVSFLLWLPPFGLFGAHHAYLGKTKWAMASALTLNVLLMGWIADAFRIPELVFTANFIEPIAATEIKPKDVSTTEMFFFWLFFGVFGGHKYLNGEYALGLLYTFTLGGLFVFWLRDGYELFFAMDKPSVSKAIVVDSYGGPIHGR